MAAHAGQTDKADETYVLHPLRVMQTCESEDAKIAAVLHDVVEDTSWTIDALESEGFEACVIEALRRLTRQDGESYETFVERAGGHPIARKVKLADLQDNMDLSRLETLTEDDLERLQRYHRALRRLHDAEAESR